MLGRSSAKDSTSALGCENGHEEKTSAFLHSWTSEGISPYSESGGEWTPIPGLLPIEGRMGELNSSTSEGGGEGNPVKSKSVTFEASRSLDTFICADRHRGRDEESERARECLTRTVSRELGVSSKYADPRSGITKKSDRRKQL